jgi:hypothetical protein
MHVTAYEYCSCHSHLQVFLQGFRNSIVVGYRLLIEFGQFEDDGLTWEVDRGDSGLMWSGVILFL